MGKKIYIVFKQLYTFNEILLVKTIYIVFKQLFALANDNFIVIF